MNPYKLVLLFIMATATATVMAEGGDPAAGKEKAQACAACHGADGNSNNPVWPKLAGQHEAYIILQLQNFKGGVRNNAQMAPMVANLTEQDMADLGAYFSQQTPKIGSVDPEYLELGAKMYRAGNADTGVPACMACHGPRGAGNPAANYPSLSGQHAAYVEAQLNAFREGTRENAVMHTIVGKMSDTEIKAVSEFVQGLH